MDKAREMMEYEIDIISLIKSRRYMNAALRELLPAEKIIELKNKSFYVEVDPDETPDQELKMAEDANKSLTIDHSFNQDKPSKTKIQKIHAPDNEEPFDNSDNSLTGLDMLIK